MMQLAQELLSLPQGPNLMAATSELEARIDALVSVSPPPAASTALEGGAGEWEVFYMPHIKRIADPLGLEVCKISSRLVYSNLPCPSCAHPIWF